MKKQISLILTAAMALSFAPCVHADSESVLATVKNRIGSTDEYDNFRSDSYEDDNHTVYSFSWSKTDGDKNLNVDCDEDGVITSFSLYDGGYSRGDGKHLPAVSRDDVEKTAREFLDKINPSISPQIKIEVDESNALSGSYRVSLTREIDSIGVYGNEGNISLNSDNTAVRSFYINHQYVTPVSDKSAFISADDAKRAYKDGIGMELVYRSVVDNNKKTCYPVYIPKRSDVYVDALTGEIKKPDTGGYGLRAENAYSSAQASAGGAAKDDAGFSAAEIQELDKIAGLISKEDAERLVRENPYFGADGAKLDYISLNRLYYDKESYSYSLSFSKGDSEGFYASLDAADGTITGFNHYNYGGAPAENVSGEDAEKLRAADEEKAKEIVSALAGNILENYVYDEESKRFRRYENGARVVDDYAYANVKNGVLENYSLNYSKNAVFPPLEGAMSPEAAADAMFSLTSYDINYMEENDGKTGCYYMTGDSLAVDPFTGESVDYDGKPVMDASLSYGDISGHWAENIIETLAVYGIGFEGGSFYPDESITRKDFDDFLDKAFYSSPAAIRYAAERVGEEISVEASANDSEAGAITRAEAAVMMIRAMGAEEYAKYDIYKQPFDDVNENVGYIALLAAMGVVRGDGAGSYHPDDGITRAEAAAMVYNYLNR